MKSSSSPSPEIRILVADSNQTQSQLLSGALRRRPSLRVSCCRSELSDCLQALQSNPADVVLLSDGVSHQDRLLDTVRALHWSHSHVGLVLTLDSFDRNLVVNAMRAGARGLFCRSSQSFRALCRCVAVVHQGQFWASTEQIGYIVEALKWNPNPRVVNSKGESLLTAREAQIANLVAEGSGNREIAQLLGIKENTIKKALLRIYEKLGISNRVELVLYVLTHWVQQRNSAVVRRPMAATSGPPTQEGFAVGK